MEKLQARAHRVAKVLKKLIEIAEVTIAKLVDAIVELHCPEIVVKRGSYCVKNVKGQNVLCFKPSQDKFGRTEPFLDQITLETDVQDLVLFLLDVPEIVARIAEIRKERAKPVA